MSQMSRTAGLVLCAIVAVAIVSGASAQSDLTHLFHGEDANPGDVVGVVDGLGIELGSATVAPDATWYIRIDRELADDVRFTLNGEVVQTDITLRVPGISKVTLVAAATEVTYPVPGSGGLAADSKTTLLFNLLIGLSVAVLAVLGAHRIRRRHFQ